MSLHVQLYIVAGLQVLGCLLTVAQVGKPKTPTGGGVAVASVVLTAWLVWVLLMAAQRITS